MGINAAGLKIVADRLVDGAGQDISIRRQTNSGTAWDPTIVTADYATVAYFADYRAFEVDGSIIRATDRRAYTKVGDLTIIPTVADRVLVDSDNLAIVSVKTFNVAGVPVLYEMQVRA